MYGTLTAVDPKAEWMQMGWMFYYDKKVWTPKRVKAFLTGVPQGKMSLLDYHCENVELWKTNDGFYGQPYIWCYLGNFGGNTTLTGNVKETGKRLDAALKAARRNMLGVGSTLEGLDVIQFPYEYVFDKVWTHSDKGNQQWIDELADRHAGFTSPSVRKAWQILFDEIFVQVPGTYSILPSRSPVLNDNHSERTEIKYPAQRLEEVWSLLLDVPQCERNELQVDLIAVGRQVLGNKFLAVKSEFDAAYAAKDITLLRQKAYEMEELLSDLDCLTSFNTRCTVNKWIDDARALGRNAEMKNYYERNARYLITLWGGHLSDYASRAWGGLIGSYYGGRWRLYIHDILASAQTGKPFDQKAFDEKRSQFEQTWVHSTTPITLPQRNDLLTFCKMMFSKYHLRSAVKLQ